MRSFISSALAVMALAAPASAATLIYKGQPFTCTYAYDLFEGPLETCPAGETVPAIEGRIVIDDTKLPSTGLAGLSLLIDGSATSDPIPDWLVSLRLTSPLWFGGESRTLLDFGFGRPPEQEEPLIFLSFDALGQLSAYQLSAFLEYQSSVRDDGDTLFGFLTSGPGPSTDVVSNYEAGPGRWELAPVPLPASALLLPVALGALAGLRRFRSGA